MQDNNDREPRGRGDQNNDNDNNNFNFNFRNNRFALLFLVALLGMFVGFRIQDRIPQSTFRTVTLWVLLIAGLNLVRRGLMGG